MKTCQHCNSSIEDNAMFCPNCGTSTSGVTNQQQYVQQKHDVPKCTHCGYVGHWKSGPILRPMDFIIGIIFLFLGVVPGIIYLVTVALIRSNEDRREKICPQCKSNNLWTFLY